SIRALTCDEARLRHDDAIREISLDSELATDASGVNFKTEGIYHGLPSTAEGRGGPVLALKDTNDAYPLEASGKVGGTSVKAKGTITNVAQLSALDLAIDIRGKTMSELYDVIGIALPETTPYATRGRLVKGDHMLRYEK